MLGYGTPQKGKQCEPSMLNYFSFLEKWVFTSKAIGYLHKLGEEWGMKLGTSSAKTHAQKWDRGYFEKVAALLTEDHTIGTCKQSLLERVTAGEYLLEDTDQNQGSQTG